MKTFVRIAALYNLSGILLMLTPGGLPAVGVDQPYSPFWVWLPGLLGVFPTVVLWLSSSDLQKFGAFAYWNGIVRLAFVVATFVLDFAATMGPFAVVLALGDLVLAIGCLVGLPRALGRSHWALLTNATHSTSLTTTVVRA